MAKTKTKVRRKKKGSIVKIALYLRKSRAEDGIQDLAKHKDYLISLCEQYGWDYELYEEIESSQGVDRDELQRLRQDIALGKIDAVMVHAVDRLSRDMLDFMIIIKRYFIEQGMTTLYVKDKEHDLLDTTTQAMLQMQATMSQAEYSFIVSRLNEGRKASIRKGIITGKVIYGYYFDKEDREVKQHPEESPIVRKIADLLLEGKPYRAICDKLNASGVRTRAGNLWEIYNIKSIVHSPLTRGHVIQDWEDAEGNIEHIEVRHSHPAIISDAEYAQIKKITDNRADHYKGLSKAPTHWLQGLLTCPHCGKVMSIAGTKPHQKKQPDGSILRYGDYVYYLRACRPYIKEGERCFNKGCQAVVAEELVKDLILDYRNEIDRKLEELKTVDGSEIKKDITGRIKDIKKDIKKIEDKEENLIELLEDKDIEKDIYNRRMSKHKEAKASLIVELQQLEESVSAVDIEQDIKHQERLKETIEQWDSLPNEDKRDLIQRVFVSIEYDRPDKDAPPIIRALPVR